MESKGPVSTTGPTPPPTNRAWLEFSSSNVVRFNRSRRVGLRDPSMSSSGLAVLRGFQTAIGRLFPADYELESMLPLGCRHTAPA